MTLMALTVIVTVMMVLVTQDQHRNAVHDQSQHGNNDCLVESDRHRVYEPIEALPHHHEGKKHQQHRSDKSAEGVYLPGAKAVALVVRVPPGITVSNNVDSQGRCVRSHV